MNTPPPPFELPATGVLWDDRFILSRMALGIAAGCWVLACLLMVMFPPSLVPPVLVPVIPVAVAVALAIGRFRRLILIGAAFTAMVAALAWWAATQYGNVALPLISALLAAGLAWLVFIQTVQDDCSGLWRDSHILSAALACCTVAAFGLWCAALWAMREFEQTGHPGINGLLLWGWMLASLWCALSSHQALKSAQEAASKGSVAEDELGDRQTTAVLGVWFAPWGLGAATLFIEAASRGPFHHILHPEQTTPLWIAIVPLVIAISAVNAARVLHGMLRAPKYAGVPMPPVQPQDAPPA